MDGWKATLHFSEVGDYVLVPTLRLYTLWDLILACIITGIICLTERLLTFAMTVKWNPLPASWQKDRIRMAAWRASLYWVVTLERTLYMLISMTFHIVLILTVVTSLAIGQFVIEYVSAEKTDSDRAAYGLLLQAENSGSTSHLRSTTQNDRGLPSTVDSHC